MKAYLIIIILFIAIPSSLMAQIQKTNAIDEKIEKNIDVTGDGKPDKITLNLKAKNIESPFIWSITIISDGKIIYSHDSDDTRYDEDFKGAGFVSGCNDYLSCKHKYYYHDILDNLVLTGNKWYDADGILDKKNSSTLYPLGRKQLKECCNITGQQADTILGKIEKKLREGKAVLLNVPISTVNSAPPMVFVPEVGRFLIIYED
jgi:hypothetical protein